MEAARVAAERGHKVTLLERDNHLGGTARFSSLTTPLNGDLVRWMAAALAEAGVEIRTSTTATPTMVAALRPDVPGVNLSHVLSGDDLRNLLTGAGGVSDQRSGPFVRLALVVARTLGITTDMDRVRSLSRRWMPIGRRVVVVGGGLAEFLADRGRSVTVLEEGGDLATEMAHPRRWRALHEARAHGVDFRTRTRLVAVTADEVVAHTSATDENDGNEVRFDADSVLLAGSVQPDSSLAEAIRTGIGGNVEVHVVGDAGTVGYIEGAIRSGYEVGVGL